MDTEENVKATHGSECILDSQVQHSRPPTQASLLWHEPSFLLSLVSSGHRKTAPFPYSSP